MRLPSLIINDLFRNRNNWVCENSTELMSLNSKSSRNFVSIQPAIYSWDRIQVPNFRPSPSSSSCKKIIAAYYSSRRRRCSLYVNVVYYLPYRYVPEGEPSPSDIPNDLLRPTTRELHCRKRKIGGLRGYTRRPMKLFIPQRVGQLYLPSLRFLTQTMATLQLLRDLNVSSGKSFERFLLYCKVEFPTNNSNAYERHECIR